jgi:hypothetical protein
MGRFKTNTLIIIQSFRKSLLSDRMRLMLQLRRILCLLTIANYFQMQNHAPSFPGNINCPEFPRITKEKNVRKY